MTARQLLAALRREVPDVAWDPLHTGIHHPVGRETITGHRAGVTVVVDGLGDFMEVAVERRVTSRGIMRPQSVTVCILGRSDDPSAVVRRALAALDAAVKIGGGLHPVVLEPPPSSRREGPRGLALVPPPRG